MTDEQPAIGSYAAADGTRYRVRRLPDHERMRFVERLDARWRLVAALPPDAVRDDSAGDQPSYAVEEVGEFDSGVGMDAWLALLEDARDDVRRGVLGLLDDYDLERSFSRDRFDLDYDADVMSCARVVHPVLLALEDAIDAVAGIQGRSRGGQADET
ncbi:hypothetical protein DSM112329_04695 [Paraconexibacter sp. AEG42_29]|uniref:Uncharacterized protein n=1 Tax=Paraconexibacter sp. AEG42_29 TaxID=2997339 RepID=A0AAU7B2P8_9ACTN